MRQFIFILGPTASGKSQLALDLAIKNNGVIFNCDSVQFYQKVDIGSAKPTLDDRKQVPHYMFDIVAPPDVMTSGEYRRLFLETLETVSKEKPIFVVGGTGFYFLALEKGLFEIQEPTELQKLEIEKEMQAPGGANKLLEEIRARDPGHAEKLHINDVYRIGRAIEILRANPERTIADMLAQKKESKGLEGDIRKIGVKWESNLLEERIRMRTQRMLADGLIEETRALLKQGLENWAPLNSVGYKETVQFLKTGGTLLELEEKIIVSTRQLAKKQRTWFQRDQEVFWIQGSSENWVNQAQNFLSK